MEIVHYEIKWAIYFSLMTMIWMLLEKWTGLHGRYIDYHIYFTNLYVIPATLYFGLALKEKKKYYYSGYMTYRQGFNSGIVLSFFVALASPLVQWIISNVISPEYFPNVIKRSVELGYYSSISEAEAHFNYINFAINSALFAFLMGMITSAVVMIFLRSKGSNHLISTKNHSL